MLEWPSQVLQIRCPEGMIASRICLSYSGLVVPRGNAPRSSADQASALRLSYETEKRNRSWITRKFFWTMETPSIWNYSLERSLKLISCL